MSESRVIAKVTPYRNPAGEARCKVQLESGEIIPLHSLTRPELSKAARMVFPEIPGNVWLRFPSDEIQRLIRKGDLSEARAAVEARPQVKRGQAQRPDMPEGPIFLEPDEEQHETVQREHESKLPALDPEEAALLEAFRASKRGVDIDQVREIVASEVQRQVVEIGVTRVEIVTPKATTELPELHHKTLPEIVNVLAAGLNLFMVGPAGSGKSTIGHQAANALGIPFYALSLGPTTPTSKLFGYMDAQGRYVRTPFREAYENGGVILLDELDNGHPGLVAEINQATANGYCAFADGMVQRHEDCRIIATGNTYGRGPDRLFVGRNILDAATLDRFVTVEIEIDERLEANLARAYKGGKATDSVIEDWIGYVCQVRRKVHNLKLPVVVSPRATIEGAKLLATGMTRDRVAEIRLFAGIDSDTRAKIA